MKRNYVNTTEETTANFFYGVEVEHTPAHGMETLFVTGIQPLDTILAYADPTPAVRDLYLGRSTGAIKHIYCGANQSYHPIDVEEHTQWDDMVYSLLKQGYWVTLDFDSRYAEEVHESGLCEKRKFIPMVSVKLPYIGLFNYNTTIKIDDKGFEETNPGVWCHRLHDLMDSTKFTNWDAYKEDKVIK